MHNAHTVNATAFVATTAALDARTIPESFLLLRDVQRMPFGPQFTDPGQVACLVSPERPILLQGNDVCWYAAQACWTPSTGWRCWKPQPRP